MMTYKHMLILFILCLFIALMATSATYCSWDLLTATTSATISFPTTDTSAPQAENPSPPEATPSSVLPTSEATNAIPEATESPTNTPSTLPQ